MRLAILVLSLWGLLSVPATLAQTPGTCQTGTAEAELDIADARVRLFNTGSLFFGNSTVDGSGYIMPRFSGNSPLFAAGVWVGGAIGGDLRVAAATYNDFEFWPGPLNEDGSLPDADDCSAFDRIWSVSVLDIERYDDEGVATPDLTAWPVDLGAPVIDGDGVGGNYNLEGGDRPEIYGHQTAFWVMNDVGNVHSNTLTEPIGLEVRVTAFVSAEALIDRQTFYRYELINRNSQPLEAARFGFFADPDLGDPSDDYVGSDSTRSMAFVYNADDDDNGGLGGGYGMNPPAFGYDLLSDAAGAMYFSNVPGFPTSDPNNGEEIYNYLRALWGDGTPLTEGGDGYMTGGPITTWAFPGDPVTEQFWSEVNIDGTGADNPPADRRNLLVSEAFTLAPGQSRTFDLALLFVQGDDRLDSISELRDASDAVQARYDGGTLFAPSTVPLPPTGTLPTPDLLAPADGSVFVDEAVTLRWTPASGADGYRIEISTEPDFSDPLVLFTDAVELVFTGPANEVLDYSWRVQAGAGPNLSAFSEVRTFTFYQYISDGLAGGTGIIETAYPGATVCPDADDPGCAAGYPGNTVWRSRNSTFDYVLTNPDNDLNALLRDVSTFEGDDFEIRFTDACATPGACLGVYADAAPGSGADEIASVPFELWNVGSDAVDVPEDDLRMIPILRALDGTDPMTAWADAFPAIQQVIVDNQPLDLPVTQRVLGVMPDRPNGYALFEAAANGFGGPGATYDPAADGDEQIDPYPVDGSDCRSQNYYADFCWRGGSNRLVAPIGGLDGLVLADLAGDGTTPPAGTVIRFDSNDRLTVDAENDAPAAPQAFRLGAAFPNPFAATATVPFEVERAGAVRLSVFDVLGRQVAVLVEGDVAAGPHRATLDGSRLATGVYLVVLEADGRRQASKVLVVR